MVDPKIKADFVEFMGGLADRLLDSQAPTAVQELPLLARPFVKHLIPWAKRAIRRGVGNAIDFVDGRIGSLTGAQMLTGTLKGLVELMAPHAKALEAAGWGSPQ